jgi:metal-sulfur cluster biosynthetic enzyme
MMEEKINPNPTVFATEASTYSRSKRRRLGLHDDGDGFEEYGDDDGHNIPIDALEIFELIRGIKDPEHPYTLEQLKVLQLDSVQLDEPNSLVTIVFTPTVPHCSMSTLIGLSIRVKLLRSLPPRFKITIVVTPGSHSSERDLNKQLNDKERVLAAMDNSNLIAVVNDALHGVKE